MFHLRSKIEINTKQQTHQDFYAEHRSSMVLTSTSALLEGTQHAPVLCLKIEYCLF